MSKDRFGELEGLRGLAAIAVVFYHFLLAFYALAFFGPTSPDAPMQNMKLEDNLYGNPVMVFLSGTFAVAIFFVLSGFVLSIGFFQTGKLSIVQKLASKRYVRLMLPALASVILCYLIFKSGVSQLHEVAAVSHSGWLASTWNFIPHLKDAIWDGVYGIFVEGHNDYNGVLWTMTTEFFGSFLIFGSLALFGKSKHRKLLYFTLCVATFNTWFLPFVVGMFLADLYAAGKLDMKERKKYFVPLFVVLGLFLGGYPLLDATNTIYSYITVPGLNIKWMMLYLSAGAILLVVAILQDTRLKEFFKKRYVSVLGKYTFSLYLVHSAVLYSFTMSIFLYLNTSLGLGYNKSVVSSILLSIPILVMATLLFEKLIDNPSIRFAGYLVKLRSRKYYIRKIKKLKRYKKLPFIKRFEAIFTR